MTELMRSLKPSPKRSPRVVALKALDRIAEAFTLPDAVRLAVVDALNRIHHRPCREHHRVSFAPDGTGKCIDCPFEVPDPEALIIDLRRAALALERARPAASP